MSPWFCLNYCSDSLRPGFNFRQHLKGLAEAIYAHSHVTLFAYFTIPYRKIINDKIRGKMGVDRIWFELLRITGITLAAMGTGAYSMTNQVHYRCINMPYWLLVK
jgi:hypothetical protein